MTYCNDLPPEPLQGSTPIQIIRHAEVRAKLGVSNGKLFDMIAKGLFPKPFVIIPGGRAVGWLGADVDAWIIGRSKTATGGAA